VIVDRALAELSPVLDAIYAANGRASIPPEHLLKGCLLIALHSIRSERQFCEQLQYNLLFKWFLEMDVETPAFDATSFTKNRDRLLSHEVAPRFFKAARLISAEHFTVDGTLLETWASLRSFQPRDAADHRPRGGGGGRNPEVPRCCSGANAFRTRAWRAWSRTPRAGVVPGSTTSR
jgi:transposase